MSENNNFVDDGNSELMKELIQILETGYISDSTTEHPADGECTEDSQPADSDKVDIRKYLEEKFREADTLSREQFEELAARCMCMQSDLNEMFNALVRKVDKRTQDLATLQQQYKNLAMQIDSTEQKILCHLATIQNPDNILLDQNHSTVATQVNEDDHLHLTISTADSEQIPMSKNQPVANEETPAIPEEPSLAKGLPNTLGFMQTNSTSTTTQDPLAE